MCRFCRCTPAKHPKRSDAIVGGLAQVIFPQAKSRLIKFWIYLAIDFAHRTTESAPQQVAARLFKQSPFASYLHMTLTTHSKAACSGVKVSRELLAAFHDPNGCDRETARALS